VNAFAAIRLDGHGDVTERHWVWKDEEGVIASPISVNGRLYIRSGRHLFCFGDE